MKKILCLLAILVLITGCTKEPVQEVESVESTSVVVPTYVDDNPITVGLYDGKNLATTYNTAKENFKDIVFSVCYTNDATLNSEYIKYDWDKYYNQYTNIDNYKIGFHFSFDANGEHITGNILGPDVYRFNPYFYIYLYDDIHQPDGAWYSHLETSDVTDKTIFSSIKIYTVDLSKVTSPIELTVFTYDSQDDFDEQGNYRGKSKYTITINFES